MTDSLPALSRPLSTDSLLTKEFEYIAQNAFQVSEDRAKVSNFYLLTVGSFVAAVLGTQVESSSSQTIFFVFGMLFLALTINGFMTLLHLVQLRVSWLDCVQAMNSIKECYIKYGDKECLLDGLVWLQPPPKFRLWSISFLLAAQVAVLGGVTLGAAISLLASSTGQDLIPVGLVAGIVYAFTQLWLYRRLLRDRADPEAS
jgi:hypothetical protein